MNVPLESPAPGPAPGPRPALGPIVSIVIVCPGQLEYTRHCVRSVLNHTSGPVELVFVDLASLDGTREFLRGFAVALPRSGKSAETGKAGYAQNFCELRLEALSTVARSS